MRKEAIDRGARRRRPLGRWPSPRSHAFAGRRHGVGHLMVDTIDAGRGAAQSRIVTTGQLA